MKILFVGLVDPNHSKAGGYHKITNMPNTTTFWDKNALLGFLKPNQSGKRFNIFFQEVQAKIKLRHYDITHFFYGDQLIYPFNHKGGKKVVATIHMNLSTRKRNPKLFIKTLQSLDAVVTLSTFQQRELKEKYGINAYFIPHGFDRPVFFKQETGIDLRKINIVVSGSNYRDINALYRTIKHCQESCPNVMFHLLGQSARVKEKFCLYNNVKCYPRLEDDMYYSVMADCDYNFLPLTFATANNALLEAQFLGIKSILPDISGIEDYAAPKPMNVFYSSQDELNSIMDRLTKSTPSSDIIKHAEQFLWENIYPKLMEFYNHIWNTSSPTQ